MGSPKIRVRREDIFKITAFLNTGTEINIITSEVIEDAGLAMQQGPKLKLVSHTWQSHLFHSFCENVEMVMGRLKIKHPIFIMEYRDHNLVLGQLFLNSMKFSQEYKPDGIFGTITHSWTKQLTVFQILASQDLTNQTENRIFSQSLNKI